MSRVLLIGDLSGHIGNFEKALKSAGCSIEDGYIPEDIKIIQVGDLIHRGPNSDKIVDLVNKFHQNSKERYIQILGNHESQYIRPKLFHWNESISKKSITLINDWWEDRWLALSSVVELPSIRVKNTKGNRKEFGRGKYLISHAGLSSGLLKLLISHSDFSAPLSVENISGFINEIGYKQERDDFSLVFKPGYMLTKSITHDAGVLWAECTSEVYSRYLSNEISFNQIHGHSNPFWFDRGAWNFNFKELERKAEIFTKVDTERRTTFVNIGESMLIGVDPGYSEFQKELNKFNIFIIEE